MGDWPNIAINDLLVSVNKTPFSWERGSTMEEHMGTLDVMNKHSQHLVYMATVHAYKWEVHALNNTGG